MSDDGRLANGQKPCVSPCRTDSTKARFGWSLRRCARRGTSIGQTILNASGYCLIAYVAHGSELIGGGLGSGAAWRLASRAFENPFVEDQFHSSPLLNFLTALSISSLLMSEVIIVVENGGSVSDRWDDMLSVVILVDCLLTWSKTRRRLSGRSP